MKLTVAEAWLRFVNARDTLTREEFERARVALEATPVAKELLEHAVVAVPKSHSKHREVARRQRALLAELLAAARKVESGEITPEWVLGIARKLF